MAQWTPPTGNEWSVLQLLTRIGLGRELEWQEGDENKISAEDAINWIGERIMTLLDTQPFQTGDTKFSLRQTAPTGWLLVDNRTIGNENSGASLTGNNYLALYTVLWAQAINTDLLTSTGAPTTKGVSASADWQALKRLYLPKIAGRTVVIAGQGEGLTNRVLGTRYGSESINYTPQGSVSQASISSITATNSEIDISELTATNSNISISGLTATSSPISASSLTATSSPINISGLGVGVSVTNGSLTPTGGAITVSGVNCVTVHKDGGTPESVIGCASLVVDNNLIAAGLQTNVSASASLTGTIPTPTITIGGTIPTPTITIGGGIPTPTITIGGSIPSPNITIGGSIPSQNFTGTQASIQVMQPSYTVNMFIKI